MASRVNTRFVTFLAIGLMLLGGGVMVAAYLALKKSGHDYVVLGDKLMAEGNFEKATEYYSKAVYKQRTNAQWVDKWIDAMGRTTPTPRQAYLDRYLKDYIPALKAYADALPEDASAQERLIGEQYRRLRIFPAMNDEVWTQFINMVSDSIKRFDDQGGEVRRLRRYRAFGNLHRLPLLQADRVAELIPSIREDLEAAYAADPTIAQTVAELANVRMMSARALRDDKDIAAADRLELEAADLLKDYLKDHSPNITALWSLMQIEFIQVSRDSQVTLTLSQLYMEKHPRFVELFEMIRAEPIESLDIALLGNICIAAQRSEKIGNAGVLEMLYELQARAPQLVYVQMLIGRFEMLSRHFDKAIEAYRGVIARPDLPLSFDGWLLFEQRAEAYKQAILAHLDARGLETTTAEQSRTLLAEAAALREKFAQYVGDSDRSLLFVDARLAYSQGDYESARINLDRYNDRTSNNDSQALLLQGGIMEQLQNIGAARTAYEAVLSREPFNAEALLNLSELEQRAQKFGAAVSYLERLQKLFPKSQPLTERLNKVRQLQLGQEQGEGAIKDKVVNVVIRVQRMLETVNPDFAGAALLLRATLEETGDISLYAMLARVLAADGRRDEALDVVGKGLERAPTSENLLRLQAALKITDPLQGVLAAIEDDEKSTPFQKAIWRHVTYAGYQKTEEAEKALAEATAIDPEHPVVLELMFRRAMANKNLDEARRIADLVAAKDIDHVGGLTFKAQLEVHAGRLDDAGASLEAALEKDRNSVPIWRQLAAIRLATNKPDLAVAAYDRALAIRPDDVESVRGAIRARAASARRDEALAFARRHRSMAMSDPKLLDLWLDLEATVPGGDPDAALQMRQELAKRLPEQRENNIALTRLLINAGRFTEAKSRIDSLRSASTDPAYVELEIRWYTAQGNIAGALETFNKWVVALPPEQHTGAPYLALAAVFTDYGRLDAAMVTLEDGRKHQDPKTVDCDRRLGEVLFLMGRYERAIEQFDKVLSVLKQDPDLTLNGQIVEAYIRLARLDEAKQRLDALGSAINSSARVLLLKAEVFRLQGNFDEAGRIYDTAIATDKSDPVGYIKRAEFLVKDPSRYADAEQDLLQALQINPRHLGARKRLAVLYMSMEQPTRAVEILRTGLSADPDNDALRNDLIELYLHQKKDREAIGAVDEALNRRPEDPHWLFRGREVMYALNRFEDAAAYAWRFWKKRGDVDGALTYLDAALKVPKTDFVKAMEVLNTPALNADRDLRLLIARARIQLKRERTREAETDLRTALGMIDQTNLNQSRAFMTGISVVYPDPAARLAALTALRPQGGYRAWFAFLYSTLKATVPASSDEGFAELRSIAESKAEVVLRKQAYAVMGSRVRSDQKFEDAIMWWKEGLKLDAADPELNNNVAYCLAEDLGRPSEALPFAEQAAKVVTSNPSSIQDTLGTVYLKLDRLDDASQALGRALSLATQEEEIAAICVHLAQVRHRQDRNAEALRLLRQADEIFARNDMLRTAFEAAVMELKAQLGAN